MKTVELMIEEHRLIERMLHVLDEAAGILERGGSAPAGMLAGILEFSRTFADAGHHAKEEDIFFPALAAHGLQPDASAVGALQVQHDSGRRLVAEMSALLPAVGRRELIACQAFAAAARDYVGLLREHIQLENHLFAEYAEEHLTADEDAALRERMDAVDRDRASGAPPDRFARMVAEYEEALLRC
ncbi:MAG TPA: hemerythrin domain-containing protein [Vicinamibacterales bacterium]|jgi:hemerythrin-like domain-containing protein|nr:hemerythrin domain-containing protein [Vicinamibacterales bacterium]